MWFIRIPFLTILAALYGLAYDSKESRNLTFSRIIDGYTENFEKPEGNLKFVYTKVEPWIQAAAAHGVVERLFPKRNQQFEIIVDPLLAGSHYKEAFHVSYETKSQKIRILGTTGVAAVFGFHDYLKYHCHCHVSWEGQQLRLPEVLPQVSYYREILDRFRYYQNVCTDSYSFVWWNWERWEKEIDWMALNGINAPLVSTGQEKVWQKVYVDLGLSYKDIEDYISGPAFLAWWRMGNIQKWGGPLPQSYMDSKLYILQKTLRRMTSLGMLPILPAFSGNVPLALKKVYPNISLIEHSNWNHFNQSYSTYMLPPSHPLFEEIGSKFLQQMIKEAGGTSHVYSCDTFNENDPSDNSTEFLHQSARSTYAAMHRADKKSVWLMQSWMFQSKFWKPQLVEAYVSGVKTGNLVVLDLEAERTPLYERYGNFYGHSFIWCMLQNYGGTVSLYGALDLVDEGITRARKLANATTMVGIGSCPEGINQNSVVFDFLYEKSLLKRTSNELEWVILYAKRRYGITNSFINDAWGILRNSIYNAPADIDNHGRSILTRRPNLRLRQKSWYRLEDIFQVIEAFINGLIESPSHLYNSLLYKHDLVDFTRQFLELVFVREYTSLEHSYRSRDDREFHIASSHLLEIMDDMEMLLRTNQHFLLGKWVNSAENFGTDDQEKRLLRYNALNQITLWGPTGEVLDYAAKQWAGNIANYYKPRWMRFIAALNSSLISGRPFQSKKFRRNVLKSIEIPFTFSLQQFPSSAEGNSIEEAIRIFTKWMDKIR